MACKLSAEQIANGMKIFHDSPDQFDDWLRAAMKPSFADKFFEYRRAAMLWGLTSPIAKGAGDVSNQVLDLLRMPVEIGLSQARAKATELPPENTWAEVGAHFQGIQDAIGPMSTILGRLSSAAGRVFTGSAEGVQGRLETLRQQNPGVSDAVLMKKALSDVGELSEMRTGAIGGRTGTIVRTPFRAFEEISNFFRGMSGQVELNKQALREAIRNGRDAGVSDAQMGDWVGRRYGDIRSQLMDAVRNGNGDVFPAMQKAIAQAQDYMTFNQKLGPALSMISAARNAPGPGGFALKMLLPFYKIPVNIARTTIEHTPLDAIRLWKHWGEFEKAGTLNEEMAKSVVGTTIGSSIALAAANGLITGSGPTDPKARADLLESGWQPYSLKLPDGSYTSYARLEPFTGIAGMAADMIEATNEEDLNARASKVTGSIMQNLVHKTFLKSIADFSGAMNEPLGAKMQRFAESTEQSLVPSIVQHAANAADPTVRDTGIATAIPSVIPGLKEMIPPKVNALGDVQTRGEGETAGERLLSPFARSQDKPEADLEREMSRLSYEPGKIEDSIRIPVKGVNVKIPLTDDEKDLVIQARQKAVEQARQLVANPNWDNIPDDQGNVSKKSLLEGVFRRYDAQARAAITRGPDYRDRARAALEEQKAKATS